MEKFVIVWRWEGTEFKVLSIEDTMDEAKKKVKKKLKSFLADNEGIEGKFDVDEYVKEHEDRFYIEDTKKAYLFEYNDGELQILIQRVKLMKHNHSTKEKL